MNTYRYENRPYDIPYREPINLPLVHYTRMFIIPYFPAVTQAYY